MDTSPDAPGENVIPVVHKEFAGGNIVINSEMNAVLKSEEHPDLKNQIGNDIITSDGTTLLGADDKAGIAEIMNAAEYLVNHPEIKHGKIKILFTPDEEVGHGVDKVDLKKLGADICYTLDGSDLGGIQNETFSADSLEIKIKGCGIHPGFAKGRMENAIKIASEIICRLPKDTMSPETTDGKEGFLHPVKFQADVDSANIKFIIRDFENEGLKEKEDLIKSIADDVISKYKKSGFEIDIKQSYRNFKEILEKNPRITEYAMEAVRRAGLTPKLESIRGGTDGSRLSFMGLPCPNIFTGGHAFHSNLEYVSVQDMHKAVEKIIHLCMIWEEKS